MKKTKKQTEPKPVEQPKVEAQKFTKEDIDAGLRILHQEYASQMLALLSHDPEINEVNYIKAGIVMPNGGNYLLSLLHIDGPKLSMDSMRKALSEEAPKA